MFYVGAFGGLASPENMDAHDVDGNPGFEPGGFNSIIRPNAITLDLDEAYFGGLVVGRDFGMVRIEMEGAYRPLEFSRISVLNAPVADSSGELDVISVMGNVYLDLPVTDWLEFYVGGGVGLAWMETRVEQEFSFFNQFSNSEDQFLNADNDIVWAYQAMAGVAVHVGPNVTLSGGVRYFTTQDPEFERTEYNGPDIPSVEVGVRVNF